MAIIRQFLSHFKNPLIVLLLAACFLSAFVGERNSAIIILVIIFLSVGLDFLQEFRASKAAESLRKSVLHKCRVLRDGIEKEIESYNIVPGDIVLLSAGDLVPADGRLFFSKDLFINQSILTGESFPVEKTSNDLRTPDNDLISATNSVFMGTSIVSGEGKMIVCTTGAQTFIGEIAEVLERPSAPSDFEIEIRKFGYLLMRMTVFLSFFVLTVNLFFQRPFIETVLFSLSLAVGMSPGFLPMVISVTLARGSLRMARKKVIVKRLSAIHDLGSLNVLCMDKTGTLTQANIKLAQHLDSEGQESIHVLNLSYLNSFFESGIKGHLESAVLENGEVDTSGWKKIDEIPFDFERRKISVLVDNGEKRLLIAKGAPEDILNSCTKIEINNEIKKLDAEEKNKILTLFKKQSQQGFRLLGIAWKKEPKSHMHAFPGDESGLIFVGFATFFDPPKLGVKNALESLKNHHIHLKIVSGDNEYVTAHLCNEIGIPVRKILTGAELYKMSDEALYASVNTVNAFCRVTPSQKTRIIEALKNRGHVVGFMGDGINDAPSLNAAHVGISTDNAVDVAKEAADIILLEKDLGVVNDGIIEGRRTFANIMKYIYMVTSSNFGNMLSMAAASIFIPFLPMLAPQILLNNLLYDLSEIAIPFDNVDKEILVRPEKWSMRFITKFMMLFGSISSIFDFLIFFIMLKILQTNESLFQTGWFIESLATQIFVIFVIRTRFSPFKNPPNPWLTFSSLLTVLIGVLIPLTPLGEYFGFVKPDKIFFAILFAMIIAYLCMAEGAKSLFYKKSNLIYTRKTFL